MGGINSGRRGGAPTKEGTGALVLDVHHLVRQAGGAARWSGLWTVTLGSGAPQRVVMVVDLDRERGIGTLRLVFDLHHFTRSTGPQDQTIALRAIPCHFGGHRWSFVCPVRRCGATRLYLPNGANAFAGRLAWGLGYASQRGTRSDRAWSVIRRVDARLDHDGAKPKWMRWRTYRGLVERRAAADDVLDAELLAAGARMLGDDWRASTA